MVNGELLLPFHSLTLECQLQDSYSPGNKLSIHHYRNGTIPNERATGTDVWRFQQIRKPAPPTPCLHTRSFHSALCALFTNHQALRGKLLNRSGTGKGKKTNAWSNRKLEVMKCFQKREDKPFLGNKMSIAF